MSHFPINRYTCIIIWECMMKDSTIFFLKCKHIILIKALDKRSCDFHKLLIGFNWMKVNNIVLIRLLLNPM